jgi:PTH1 family peptidyl-tRNA hydrolase
MSKFLIAGLGNIGEEYSFTRHNIGFEIVDALAKSLVKSEDEKSSTQKLFSPDKLASVNSARFKGKSIIIIKPATYMNLSGKAVNYWMQAEKISIENILIVADDLALPFGTLRMKKKGSDGGHNGFTDIIATLNTSEFTRLRFGIGSEFSKGKQVNYVLGKWSEEENKLLPERIGKAVEMIKSFISIGIERTMTAYNNK